MSDSDAPPPKRTYRIRLTSGKVLFVMLGIPLGWAVALMFGTYLGNAVGSLVFMMWIGLMVIVAGRVFRGQYEPAKPRPWWRLSYSPKASVFWAVLFGSAGLSQLLGSGSRPTDLVGFGVPAIMLLVAAGFTYSAIRLSRTPKSSAA